MMLDMADIDELVLQLGHAIPTEATFGAVEIQHVHGVVDHPIAELPVLEHLRLRVRLTLDAVALAAMLFPQPKRSFVALKIKVCKEQRVIRHLPELILVVGAQPLLGRAAQDGFAEHRQRRVVLAFQHGSKHRMRVVHRLDCTSRVIAESGTQPRTSNTDGFPRGASFSWERRLQSTSVRLHLTSNECDDQAILPSTAPSATPRNV